jgi:hypothetical protein
MAVKSIGLFPPIVLPPSLPKLGNNSFLAQATVGAYKRGVFFEISNNNIKVTAARYCPLTKCQKHFYVTH